MGEFFDHRTAWHRALWQVGTVLGLEEVLEYAETVRNGQPRAGLEYVCRIMHDGCRSDPGLGGSAAAAEVAKHLAPKAEPELPAATAALEHLIDRSRDGYLLRWAAAVSAASPPVELTARSVAAHLLEEGFSGDHLHGWLSASTKSLQAPNTAALSGLLEDAAAMCARPFSSYDVLLPLTARPRAVTQGVFRYLSQDETLRWIARQDTPPPQRRPAGALLVSTSARDPWAAVERVAELVARVAARVAVGIAPSHQLRLTGDAWVQGRKQPLPLAQARRQVRVPALDRHEVVYQAAPYERADPLDDALELLASMEGGTRGAAIAGGWAAIEGLLRRPAENPATLAADRLADITACSFAYAELARLLHVFLQRADTPLAQRLRAMPRTRDRVAGLERAMRDGSDLPMYSPAEQAALARVETLFTNPAGVFARIRQYHAGVFRRLYSQRNLLMHSGTFRSVALRATLRTAPALVGAGIDRIVHTQVESAKNGSERPLTALQLHARAQAELNLVGTSDARLVSRLLG